MRRLSALEYHVANLDGLASPAKPGTTVITT